MPLSRRHRCTIGVSGLSATTKSVRALMRQIRAEHAAALFLSSRTVNLAATVMRDLAHIDALVVMGNDLDIDPKCYVHRYAENDPRRRVHPETKSELSTAKGKRRARYEEAMIAEALKRGMPVLGICGGMQRLNVLTGGTLHQHIPDLVGCDKHMQKNQGIALHIPVVPIIIKEHTQLAHIAGGIKMPFATSHSTHAPKVIMENSLHHQSIDRIGTGLSVCAVTDTVRMQDGTFGYLAEAVETDPDGCYAGQFILGVQWHPEFGASSLGEHIVKRLVAETARYRQRKTQRLSFRRVRSIHTPRLP